MLAFQAEEQRRVRAVADEGSTATPDARDGAEEDAGDNVGDGANDLLIGIKGGDGGGGGSSVRGASGNADQDGSSVVVTNTEGAPATTTPDAKTAQSRPAGMAQSGTLLDLKDRLHVAIADGDAALIKELLAEIRAAESHAEASATSSSPLLSAPASASAPAPAPVPGSLQGNSSATSTDPLQQLPSTADENNMNNQQGRAESDLPPLGRGDKVVVHGLADPRSLQYNHASGQIGQYDANKDRYTVILDPPNDKQTGPGEEYMKKKDRKRIKIKKKNIMFVTAYSGYPVCIDTKDEAQNTELVGFLSMHFLGALSRGTADHLVTPIMFTNTMFVFHIWRYVHVHVHVHVHSHTLPHKYA